MLVRNKKSLFAIASLYLLRKAEAVFNATSNSNIVYYWGQNSVSVANNDPTNSLWQKPLAYYCDNEMDTDIIVVSFLHQFGQGRPTAYDLANRSQDCKGLIPGTQLLDCAHMENEIKYCQSKHKKIILSMGGATPAYGLETIKEGEELADDLWNIFAGGNSIYRPFGNASIDGFDLDIENGAKMGYTAFVNRMRKNYETDTSKTYYIAAAPQCPFPDYFLGDTLNDAWFDFVMIQFYNNYCNLVNPPTFNYDIWDEWAKTRSINKNVRLFVGIPGSPTAAEEGYVPYTQLVNQIQPLQSRTSFGGIMVWDASQAYGNTEDVLPSYAHGITRLIKGPVNSLKEPKQLSPASIRLSPKGSIVQPPIATVTATTPITVTVISTVTSTLNLPLISSTTPACSTIVTNYTTYSTNQVVLTTTMPNPTLPKQYTESLVTSETIIEYVTTNSTTICDSVAQPTLYPDLTGKKCSVEGMVSCSGINSYVQCVFGQYVIRNCTTNTVCRQNHDTHPPSIFCGFP